MRATTRRKRAILRDRPRLGLGHPLIDRELPRFPLLPLVHDSSTHPIRAYEQTGDQREFQRMLRHVNTGEK